VNVEFYCPPPPMSPPGVGQGGTADCRHFTMPWRGFGKPNRHPIFESRLLAPSLPLSTWWALRTTRRTNTSSWSLSADGLNSGAFSSPGTFVAVSLAGVRDHVVQHAGDPVPKLDRSAVCWAWASAPVRSRSEGKQGGT